MHFCSALYTQHLPQCLQHNRAFNNKRIMNGGDQTATHTWTTPFVCIFSRDLLLLSNDSSPPGSDGRRDPSTERGLWPGFLSRPFRRSQVPYFTSSALVQHSSDQKRCLTMASGVRQRPSDRARLVTHPGSCPLGYWTRWSESGLCVPWAGQLPVS